MTDYTASFPDYRHVMSTDSADDVRRMAIDLARRYTHVLSMLHAVNGWLFDNRGSRRRGAPAARSAARALHAEHLTLCNFLFTSYPGAYRRLFGDAEGRAMFDADTECYASKPFVTR